MVLAQRVLVEEHRMGFVSDLTLTVVVFVLIFFKLLVGNDLFIVEVDVEQDLSRVLFQ